MVLILAGPTEAQCFHTGAMLAKMHLAGQDFPLKMKNPRYDDWWRDACTQLLPVLDSEDAALLQSEIAALDENLGEHLPPVLSMPIYLRTTYCLMEMKFPALSISIMRVTAISCTTWQLRLMIGHEQLITN